MRTKAVTFIAHEIRSTGGMERAQQQIIEGFLRAGWEVTLVARLSELSPHPRLRWQRILTPRRPFFIAYPLFWMVAGLRLMAAADSVKIALGAIVPNRVEVITVQFCHHGFRDQMQAGPRQARGGRLAALGQMLSSRMALWGERWCYRPGRVDRFVPVSARLAEELEEHFAPAVERAGMAVIPNGVDLDVFCPDALVRREVREHLGISPDANVAAFVGGDWERKGLRIAIEATAAASWHLVVAGHGDIPGYERLATSASAQVSFMGPVRDVHRVFAAADAFVLPTRYEGFALVALEAAASALAVLTTRESGAPALVDDGVNGWILPREPTAFAEALRNAAVSPERRRALGAAARESARQFSWPAIAGRYERLLNEMAPSARSAM